jgi:hypothetical protein
MAKVMEFFIYQNFRADFYPNFQGNTKIILERPRNAAKTAILLNQKSIK